MSDLFDKQQRPRMTWRERYNEVLRSPRWRRLRARWLERCSNKCQRCGWEKKSWDKTRTLDLHHRSYERLGQERDEDLELICSVCHTKADLARAEEGRRQSENALYDARFAGWAEKRFGEDWDAMADDWMVDEFQDWLERQD